jgi:hypothetical protein
MMDAIDERLAQQRRWRLFAAARAADEATQQRGRWRHLQSQR